MLNRNRLGALLRKALAAASVVFLLAPIALIALYRFVPPPATPLMLIRLSQGHGLEKSWLPLDRIAPELGRAVIAAEDNLFCRHHGFDWQAVRLALDEWEEGGRLRGASTITMQTAKNLFLWPGQSWLRKGAEAYLAAWIELLWPKRRILEVYLNVAEWGPGVYGAEAAAQAHFGRPAGKLSLRQATLLAAVLPSPLRWSPREPSGRVSARASTTAARIAQLGPLLDCVP